MTATFDVQAIDVINCSSMDNFQEQILDIYERIEEDGFALVQAWDTSRETFKEIAQCFGHIQNHPNADETGVVKVIPDHARKSENTYERFISKTTTELLPHTDGTYLDGVAVVDGKVLRIAPPNFVIFQCVQPAEQGGVSFVVDTQEILQRLWDEEPEHAQVVTQPRTVTYCAAKHFSTYSPLFEQLPSGRWRIRFRSDVMYIEPWAYSSVKHVVENYLFNPNFRKSHLLTKGQMLILDNHRVLHSRDAIISDNPNRVRLLNKAWIWDASTDYLLPFIDLPPDPKSFEVYNIHLPVDLGSAKTLRPIQTGIKLEAEGKFKSKK